MAILQEEFPATEPLVEVDDDNDDEDSSDVDAAGQNISPPDSDSEVEEMKDNVLVSI
jgi:hypothetical protein